MRNVNDKQEPSWYWFLLSNTPGLGPKSIHYLHKTLKALKNEGKDLSIEQLFKMSPKELSTLFPEIGRNKFSKASFSRFAELDFDKLHKNFQDLKSQGVTIVTFEDAQYPCQVLQKMADNAPPILYCKGYCSLLNNTQSLSIVGSRQAGEKEVEITKRIAQALAEEGFNVVSGYAKGIDIAAHTGALEAKGTTTMVLSFGINHLTLKKEIKNIENWGKNTLFITQFEPQMPFSAQNAMIRNKLVGAMSQAMIVITSGPEKDEQGKMSGTFDAAQAAIEMKIPVYVLSPQRITPPPQGNPKLIEMGGTEFSNETQLINLITQARHTKEGCTNTNPPNPIKVTPPTSLFS